MKFKELLAEKGEEGVCLIGCGYLCFLFFNPLFCWYDLFFMDIPWEMSSILVIDV
jgi:hypothetical protein